MIFVHDIQSVSVQLLQCLKRDRVHLDYGKSYTNIWTETFF